MPRTATAPEVAVLEGGYRRTWYRVKVRDAAGVMRDMGDYTAYDWLSSVALDRHIDQPISAATIVLRREIDLVGGLGMTTLSPLRTDSPANPTGPAVTVYRDLTVDMAVVTGARPADASPDWKRVFEGVTDRVSMPDDNTIKIECRDKGAYFIDQWSPEAENRDLVTALGGYGGRWTIERLLNELLKYAPITPGAPEKVRVVGDLGSTYQVTSFPMKFAPVMDLLQRAASLVVGDFRYGWNEAEAKYQPTLTIPDRDPSSTSLTFGSSNIVGWRNLEIDRLGVRNSIVLSYLPKGTTTRTKVAVSDPDSIAAYGTRVLTLVEADDSTIDTAAEATDMANLILADLKDPKATAEIEILPDWRIELGDYLTFSENEYFDIDQDLAVVGIRHVLEPNKQRTFLTCRGAPSGGYTRWVNRARSIPPPDSLTPADNGISGISFTDNDVVGKRTYTWTRGTNVAFLALYETLANAPVTVDPFPAPDAIPAMVAAGTPGASILSTATNTWVAMKPPRGKQRFGMVVPYYKLGGRLMGGEPWKAILEPLPTNVNVMLAEQNDSAVDGYTNLALLVYGSASDWPLTVEVWEGPEDGPPDFTYVVSANTDNADVVAGHLQGLALPYAAARVWSVKATNVAGEVTRISYTERNALPASPGQGSITVAANGAWAWSEDGPDVQGSVRYAESTAGFPSEATAIAGASINGSNVTRTGGTPLAFGETIYVTIVPFTGAAGTGTQLATIRLLGSRQTFTASKTITYPAMAYIPNPSFPSYIDGSGQLAWVGDAEAIMPIVLPIGVTITNVGGDIHLDGSDLPSTLGLNGLMEYVGNDVTESAVKIANASVGGWQVAGGSTSHVVTGPLYFRQQYGGGTNVRFGPVTLTYTMPSPDKAL